MPILDLWGVSFHAVEVFGLGKDFLIKSTLGHCTEVRFASFLSGGFNTDIVVNSLERKLAKRISVQCVELKLMWQCYVHAITRHKIYL